MKRDAHADIPETALPARPMQAKNNFGKDGSRDTQHAPREIALPCARS